MNAILVSRVQSDYKNALNMSKKVCLIFLGFQQLIILIGFFYMPSDSFDHGLNRILWPVLAISFLVMNYVRK